jgi:hypothetical protein
VRIRMWLPLVVAMGTLAGCGASDDGGTATPPVADSPPTSVAATAAPSRTPSSTTRPAANAALTCDGLRNGELNSAAADQHNYPQEIRLVDGGWTGDGLSVSSRECAVGDLDGDGHADGITSLVFNNGGTGQFYYLAYWHNDSGQPVYESAVNLGDRTPVETITIADGKATVVLLTRTADLPEAATNIRRTSIYRLSGATLVEEGHTDAPYQP